MARHVGRMASRRRRISRNPRSPSRDFGRSRAFLASGQGAFRVHWSINRGSGGVGPLHLHLPRGRRPIGDQPQTAPEQGDRQERDGRDQRRARGPSTDPSGQPRQPSLRSRRDRLSIQEAVKVLRQRRGAGVAEARLPAQALEADGLQVAGHLAVEPRRRRGVLGDQLPDGLRRRRRPERRSARQQFVQDRSQSMDVDGGTQRLRPGLGLLGGHVAGRPDRGAGPGEVGLAIQPPGQPEIADLGRAVGGEEDIGRFQVAMHDPAPVGRLDRFGQGRQQRGGLVGRQGRARQFLGEVAPLDKLHGEVG